ncbi:uncharacterized protein LOC106653104 [Trichogramma pretiosum]|uniref:uncharacterized protein LOC106653104 n=1 Tax=Trichogramma pretiosum TaxID=7493 RepID=UPI000C71B611|nr:uncharacterized protein LOC106653104 [Trichogramma pretiosum]
MFRKVVFLIVIGCAIVLASPSPKLDSDEKVEHAEKPSLGQRLSGWWQDFKARTKNLGEKVKNKVVKIYERVSGKEAQKSREQVKKLEDDLNRVDQQYKAILAEQAAKVEALRAKLEDDNQKLVAEVRRQHERELAQKERELEKTRDEIRTKVNRIIGEYQGIYTAADKIVRQKYQRHSSRV